VKTPPEERNVFDVAFERIHAIEQAKQAFGIEDRFRNYYECEKCQIEWTDLYSCAPDMQCPGCHRDYSPYDSVDLDEEANDA